ncbi:MAG: NAD(P)H-binding protein, partial [Anaerolineales bacterium]
MRLRVICQRPIARENCALTTAQAIFTVHVLIKSCKSTTGEFDMKLIVIGASRGVGRAVTELALEQGHQVTAFVRNASSLDLKHASLTIATGDVT